MDNYQRPVFSVIRKRLLETRRFIQVLAGPRQVGKTTLAGQVIEKTPLPTHYVSADEPTLRDRAWLGQQWDIARMKTKAGKASQPVLFVIDEIQKVSGWSETVKRLWDEDTKKKQTSESFAIGIIALASAERAY